MLAQINIGKRVLTVENESLKPENSQKDSLFHVERCLDNWSRWMRGTEAPDGLPQEACVGENYTTYDAHSEQAYDKLDIWLAETTNAAIEGLEASEQASIYARYLGLSVAFWRGGNYLDSAKEHLADSLRRRGVWLGA